jgi:hypothetical protein
MIKTQLWVLRQTREANREFFFLIARKISRGKNILAGNSAGRLELSAAYLEFGQPSLRILSTSSFDRATFISSRSLVWSGESGSS